LHGQHAVAGRLPCFVQRCLAPARAGYTRAFFLQAFCRRQPDATVSARYHCYFSCQSWHVGSPFAALSVAVRPCTRPVHAPPPAPASPAGAGGLAPAWGPRSLRHLSGTTGVAPGRGARRLDRPCAGSVPTRPPARGPPTPERGSTVCAASNEI